MCTFILYLIKINLSNCCNNNLITLGVLHSVFTSYRYRSRKDPNYVDYSTFSDEIESVFTMKDLEKMPTVEVQCVTVIIIIIC